MKNGAKKAAVAVCMALGWILAAVFALSAWLAFSNNATLKDWLEKAENAQYDSETYDFYITLGTMPTLYATLNAYTNQNPNTYMWFLRGNTISYEYSAEYIHYFESQSESNADSEIDYQEIRDKVRDIRLSNPAAKFRLFCDDLRVRFILDIFVAAGVDFEDLQVTLLSDGTGTYSLYQEITEQSYLEQADMWNTIEQAYEDHRDDDDYCYFGDKNGQALDLQEYAFYISTFSNVSYWMQHPDYLQNDLSETLNAQRYNMNIVKKDPKAMYDGLDAQTRAAYQKVVLANALVDSDTLETLEDAVEYFDSQLSDRDKPVVLILGTSYDGLEHNQTFIDQTIAYYTPTRSQEDQTKVLFKGKEYTVASDADRVVVDGNEYKIGEISVYLFFKGHPSYPADQELQAYFAEENIVVLPHRTPVEVLFWMYDVQVGGYESTSFLSCTQGQTEFFFGEPTNAALVAMRALGFFDGVTVFEE